MWDWWMWKIPWSTSTSTISEIAYSKSKKEQVVATFKHVISPHETNIWQQYNRRKKILPSLPSQTCHLAPNEKLSRKNWTSLHTNNQHRGVCVTVQQKVQHFTMRKHRVCNAMCNTNIFLSTRVCQTCLGHNWAHSGLPP